MRNLYPYVSPGCDVRGAAGLHHDGADVINEDSRTRDDMARLQVLEHVCRCVLTSSHLLKHAHINFMPACMYSALV